MSSLCDGPCLLSLYLSSFSMCAAERATFFILKGQKIQWYFVKHEPYMKFKFRCSYIKFYSNTTTSFIYTSSVAVFRLKCRVVVIEMVHDTFSLPTAAVHTTHCSHSVMIPQVFQCHTQNILLFTKN